MYMYLSITISIYNVRNYIYAHASILACIHTCTQIHRCAYPHAGGALSSDGAGALLGPEFTPTDVEWRIDTECESVNVVNPVI